MYVCFQVLLPFQMTIDNTCRTSYTAWACATLLPPGGRAAKRVISAVQTMMSPTPTKTVFQIINTNIDNTNRPRRRKPEPEGDR